MAPAQGSGEPIWWPDLVAKYGLAFLCLLIPACLLQYPLNLECGRYTPLTGESIFHGFFRPLVRRLRLRRRDRPRRRAGPWSMPWWRGS